MSIPVEIDYGVSSYASRTTEEHSPADSELSAVNELDKSANSCEDSVVNKSSKWELVDRRLKQKRLLNNVNRFTIKDTDYRSPTSIAERLKRRANQLYAYGPEECVHKLAEAPQQKTWEPSWPLHSSQFRNGGGTFGTMQTAKSSKTSTGQATYASVVKSGYASKCYFKQTEYGTNRQRRRDQNAGEDHGFGPIKYKYREVRSRQRVNDEVQSISLETAADCILLRGINLLSSATPPLSY